MPLDQQGAASQAKAARLGCVLTSWVDYLPARLRRVVPREFAGYVMISCGTFLLDVALLTIFRHRMHMPVSVAVSISYAIGFTINYILNRTLNFQSHAPVVGQLARYSVVVIVDFLLTVGVTSGLIHLGLDLRVARLLAGSCVGLVTFAAYRWWVFNGQPRPQPMPVRVNAGSSR